MHSNGNVLLWCRSAILRRTIRNYLLDNAYTAIVCNRPEEIGMALAIDDFLLLITDATCPDDELDKQLAREPQLPVLHITGQWPELKLRTTKVRSILSSGRRAEAFVRILRRKQCQRATKSVFTILARCRAPLLHRRKKYAICSLWQIIFLSTIASIMKRRLPT